MVRRALCVVLVALAGAPVFGEDTVPELLKALASEDFEAREKAIIRLGKLGPEAKPAIPALVRVLSDQSLWLRDKARQSLREIGAVPELVKALSHREADVRWRATKALAAIGEDAKDAAPALCKALKDENSQVRLYAVIALSETGGDPATVVPALIETFKDGDSQVAVFAAHTGMPKFGAAAVARLLPLLEGDDSDLRRGATIALGHTKDKRAIASLIRRLRTDLDVRVRREAGTSLSLFGPDAKEAIPWIYQAIVAKEMVAWDLTRFGADAVPALRLLLKNPDRGLRVSAVSSLGWIGPDAVQAVPNLVELLDDKDYWVRDSTCGTLARIGPKAKPAVPSLLRIIGQDRDELVRLSAIQCLRSIHPGHRAVVPALIVVLKSNDDTTREFAAMAFEDVALGGLGPDTALAMNALVDALLNDRCRDVRVYAARALGHIGPPATNVIPVLTRVALQDPDKDVAVVCRAAIGWILEANEN